MATTPATPPLDHHNHPVATSPSSPPPLDTLPPTQTPPLHPPHDDHTGPLEPPHPPYAPSLLVDNNTPPLASSSTHTSFTRVDQTEVPRSAMSQDPQNTSEPSPARASSEDQDSHAPEAPPQDGSVVADGPSTPTPTLTPPSQQEPVVPQTPQTFLTFLLVSGKRRTMSFEPETTIGRVKELIWNAWPTEWQDERPPAPSFLRVLYLGRVLQDDDTLTKLKIISSLPNTPQPTIVHLSIRPYPLTGDDSAIKNKRKVFEALNRPDGADTGSAGCCGCIIC